MIISIAFVFVIYRAISVSVQLNRSRILVTIQSGARRPDGILTRGLNVYYQRFDQDDNKNETGFSRVAFRQSEPLAAFQWVPAFGNPGHVNSAHSLPYVISCWRRISFCNTIDPDGRPVKRAHEYSSGCPTFSRRVTKYTTILISESGSGSLSV